MSRSRIVLLAALACFAAAADDSKPNLSGNWKLKEPAKTASSVSLIIEQKGTSFHVIRTMVGTDGKEKKAEFNCATDGKECECAGSKVQLYFDGASLVEMNAGGEAVFKIVMKLEGDALKVELTHIYPDGAPETFLLAKN